MRPLKKSRYKITPLEFDLWAWDNQHQQKFLPKKIEDCKK